MPVEQRIRHFTDYFNRQLEAIQALRPAEGIDPESNQIRFYKKVLLVTALDTLAGIRYPKANYPDLNRKNQERFISFIAESGAWPQGAFASVPFLARRNLRAGKLLDLVNQRNIDHEDRDFSVPLRDIDLPMVELLKAASTEQEEKAVRENQHLVLLYKYRNYLVHESREPGFAMEIGEDQHPYYHGYINDTRLYLCYPLAHFVALMRGGLQYLDSFLLEHQLDPYEFVTDTSTW